MVCSNFLACHNEQNFYENLSEISTFYKTGNISSLLALRPLLPRDYESFSFWLLFDLLLSLVFLMSTHFVWQENVYDHESVCSFLSYHENYPWGGFK